MYTYLTQEDLSLMTNKTLTSLNSKYVFVTVVNTVRILRKIGIGNYLWKNGAGALLPENIERYISTLNYTNTKAYQKSIVSLYLVEKGLI